jgi:hypothetical protein
MLQPYHTTPRLINKRTLLGPKAALVPVAGYHFETNPIYTQIDPSDPAPAGYIPWKWSDFKAYAELWNWMPPSRCSDYKCIIAQGGYANIVTPMFVVQSIIDSVVLNLHGACPTVWGGSGDQKQCYSDAAPCYPGVKNFMQIWHGNMTDHLHAVKDKHMNLVEALYPRVYLDKGVKMDGAFGAACLMHTEFALSWPHIDEMNYFEALKKWWDDDSVEATSKATDPKVNPHFHMDRCAEGDVLCGKCKS